MRPERERAAAARALHQVTANGRTTDQLLDHLPTALSRELLFGTLRYFCTLDETVRAHLERPLRDKDNDLRCLMLVGAYQLLHTRIPDHAAVHATVAACRTLGKPWARGLINGVLRHLQRAPERSFEPTQHYPAWYAKQILQDFPGHGTAILIGNLERAPMALRINTTRTTVDQYQSRLGLANTEGFVPEQCILEVPVPIRQLPGYAEGMVSIQDAGAGFAPSLLPLAPGQTVLDACAAPGGKLFHMMEAQPALGRVVAVERSIKRSEHLRAEAHRLGHAPEIVTADARRLDWWDGNAFDMVLVDAPCSGSGTLRRHPEVKLLSSTADLPRFAAHQIELLRSAWQTLRTGGSLLYCTCSLFFAENDDVIEEFLAHTDDAAGQAIALPTGVKTDHGWQLTPADPRTDGFYYALLTKEQPAT